MTTHRLWPLPDAPLFSPLFFFSVCFCRHVLLCRFLHISLFFPPCIIYALRITKVLFSTFGTLCLISHCFFNICALWTGNIDAPHVQVPKSWHMARSVYRRARSKLEAFCLFIHLYYKSACIASVASIGSWVVRTAFYHSWMQGDKWACVRVVGMTIKQELVF